MKTLHIQVFKAKIQLIEYTIPPASSWPKKQILWCWSNEESKQGHLKGAKGHIHRSRWPFSDNFKSFPEIADQFIIYSWPFQIMLGHFLTIFLTISDHSLTISDHFQTRNRVFQDSTRESPVEMVTIMGRSPIFFWETWRCVYNR